MIPAALAASRMSPALKGIERSQDFSNLSRSWSRRCEKCFQIEFRKTRAREPQPQCRAYELGIAAGYFRERPKYDFVLRIAESMFPQPPQDLAARGAGDRALAQRRQQSPLRRDSCVSRIITRAVVCRVLHAITRNVSRTAAPPIVVMRTLIRSVARSGG